MARNQLEIFTLVLLLLLIIIIIFIIIIIIMHYISMHILRVIS